MNQLNHIQITAVSGGIIGGGKHGWELSCGDIQVTVGTGGINLQGSFSQFAACFREMTGGDEAVPMYSPLYWQGTGEAGHDFGEDYSGQGWTVG